MKFSHQLALNSVPDWGGAYVNYDQLKKQIYAIEKQLSAAQYAVIHDAEQGIANSQDLRSLSNQGLSNMGLGSPFTPESFILMLDAELDRICGFYVKKEQDFFHTLDALTLDISNVEKTYSHHIPHWDPLAPHVPSTVVHSSRSTTFTPSNQHLNKHATPSPLSSPYPAGTKPAVLFPSETSENDTTHDEHDATPAALVIVEEDGDDELDDEGEENFPLLSTSHSSLISSTPMQHSFLQRSLWAQPVLKSQRTLLKRQLLQCYADLADLHDYVKLNRTGFSKILKKFDKLVAPTPLRQAYMIKVNAAYPFLKETSRMLEEKLLWNSQLYTRVVTFGDAALAKAELQCLLREHITYERNTIWRDMISKEREVLSLGINKPRHAGGPKHCHVFGLTWLQLPWFLVKPLCFAIGLMLFFWALQLDWFVEQSQQSCFAVLVLVSWWWATETFPLFVTSLTIPFLVVLLRILRDPKTLIRLDTHAATKYIFATMWSSVITLLLGSFSIAGALSKHHIAKLLAISLLKKAGTRSAWVLLVIMLIASFASMWISNVASPVLCFSIIQPILRTLPPAGASLGKALIMGIALASNIGGMASPIASPQNLIALENMVPPPSWTVWFLVAIPLCVVSNVLVWLLLLAVYRPYRGTPDIVPLRAAVDEAFTWKQWCILLITLATVVMWCFEAAIETWVGDMAVIAMVPIILFFGLGFLTKEDFNHFLWSVIVLAMGGIALGKTVENCGLLNKITGSLQDIVQTMSLWQVTLTCTLLLLIVATFISHTVAALIILPIIKVLGDQFPEPHSRLLVMASAFMCSGAMGLPVSGFPNMNAISLENPITGNSYLTTYDFIIAGIPGSVIVWLCIVTLGYALMRSLGL